MGTGFHGGFGKTYGVKRRNSVPVNSLGDVRYSKKKTMGYLLNPNHPIGASKAKFMKEILGYSQEDAKLFHKNVVSAIIVKTPTKSEQTKYGIKHTYNTILQGKNGKSISAKVVVVIQKDNKRTTYKIVTVYPDKKE